MRINEQTAFTADANFLEDSGAAAVPSTVHWKVLCIESDTVLQYWTALTVTYTTGEDESVVESEVSWEVPATLHTMQTGGLAVERKALIVAADKGLSTEYNTEFVYEVERLNART